MVRVSERLFVAAAWLSTLMTLAVVGIFVGSLLYRGLGTLGTSLLFGNVPIINALIGKLPVWHGIWPAIVGTLFLVLLSSTMAIPLGLASGIYFAEYAEGRWKDLLSFAVDLLAGTPSIIMGLFGFSLILFLRKAILPGANVCLLLAALCLALLVLPYMVRTTQVALESLPESTRLVGPSLGLTRWENIRHVLLPASSRALLSGVILSVGRAAEDTAVILLTGVVANAGLPASLTDKFEALPFTIYYLAAEYRTPEELDRGFGSALLLLVITVSLFVAARMLQGAFQREWQ
ncbi:MAG: phosphate ABC transporter permease PstA [Desulfomonile sp.]|nr:phosphate ABC transporter permease PstA [Desulfomonile sp.]